MAVYSWLQLTIQGGLGLLRMMEEVRLRALSWLKQNQWSTALSQE